MKESPIFNSDSIVPLGRNIFYLNLIINITSYFILLINLLSFQFQNFSTKYSTFFITINLILFIIAFLFHIYCNTRINRKIFLLIALLTFALLCSYAFNGFHSGKLSLIIVFFGYIYLFGILPKYKLLDLFERTINLYCLATGVLPVLLYLMFRFSYMLYDGCFIGFSSNRSAYGYIAGLTILTYVIKNNKLSYLIIPIAIYGLLIAQTRTSLIAMLVSSMYIIINRQQKIKKWNLYFVGLFVLLFAYYLFTHFTTRNIEVGDMGRVNLLLKYFDFIKSNPIWGFGGDYMVKIYSQQGDIYRTMTAHNVIFQTWASFGVFVLILFLILFFKNMFRFSTNGKAFFLYLFLLGLFQPALGIGVGVLLVIITMTAVYYN